MRQELLLVLTREQIQQFENTHLAKVYNKRDVVIARGKGAIVWDVNGKEYIDCMAGYGTTVLGHAHPRVVQAVREQAELLLACHSSLYNESRARLAQKIAEIAPQGLTRAFLSNSGTEAVETAFKVARKHTGRREIIAMMRSFHGKTFGSLSATWDSKYRKPFEPLLPFVKFVPFGKIDKLKDAVNADTAAVIVEPVQGEGGIHVSPNGYLQELRELCDSKSLLLIHDEIQTGFARTGQLFASQHWNVTPDIMCLAKAGASGVPIGITIAREEVMSSLKTGEHSSTFGGNPLACAAAVATIEAIMNERTWEKAADLGHYFREGLRGLAEKHKIVREIRGLGLMIGLELRFEVQSIMKEMLDRGVILLNAGLNVLRFLPPAAITLTQIDAIMAGLDLALVEKERQEGAV